MRAIIGMIRLVDFTSDVFWSTETDGSPLVRSGTITEASDISVLLDTAPVISSATPKNEIISTMISIF
jgi:hypothetical protein